MPMMSGPLPLWIAAAVFGWMSLALTNSMLTTAPVSFMKPSSICFLKYGSASGMKLDHCNTESVTPERFIGLRGAAGAAAAGAAAAAAGDGEAAAAGDAPGDAAGDAPAAGEAAAAGAAAGEAAAAGAAGFGASVGLGASAGLAGGAVAPPQAVSSNRPVVPTAAWRKPRRVSGRGAPGTRESRSGIVASWAISRWRGTLAQSDAARTGGVRE